MKRNLPGVIPVIALIILQLTTANSYCYANDTCPVFKDSSFFPNEHGGEFFVFRLATEFIPFVEYLESAITPVTLVVTPECMLEIARIADGNDRIYELLLGLFPQR